MLRTALKRISHWHNHLQYVGVAVCFWLLTMVGTSAIPNMRVIADVTPYPGYGAYAVEITPAGALHWLTADSSLVVPLSSTGWHILEMTARIPSQNQRVQIRTEQQHIATFTLNSTAFRRYATLVVLPPQQTSPLWLHIVSDHNELINERYIALAIQHISLQRLSHWQLPPLDFSGYVMINVLLVALLAGWMHLSRARHMWLQGTLAITQLGFTWLTVLSWGQLWSLAHIISPGLSISIALCVIAMGYALFRLIKQHTRVAVEAIHTYRPDIDGIRAIAVLSVVVYHVFPRLLPGGFVGVDMFFVISGFLITQNMLTAHAKQHFSLGDFYQRRIRRIVPALSIVLVFTSVLAWLSLFPKEFVEIGTHIIASVGFFNNIYLYTSLDYFSDIAIQKPLLHLWSLGIEEQFYIVWPFIIAMLVRQPQWRAGVFTGLVMASFVINIIGIQFQPEATFYLLPSRLWQLAIGGILAHLSTPTDQSLIPARLATGVTVGAGGAVLTSIVLYHHQLAYPGWYALIPTLATVVLIAAGPHAWLNRTLLAHPILVWVGLISYPLYLWHWPLLAFATYMAELWLTPLVKIGIIGISVLCATATYIYVERPLRFGRYRQFPVWGILAIFGGIGTLGIAIQTGHVSAFVKPAVVNLRESNQVVCDTWLDSDTQHIPLAGNCYAHIPVDPAPRTHIVIGDSHARAYTAGLIAADPQAAVFGYASDGCLPLRNIERYDNTSPTAYGCGNPLKLESALQITQRAVGASQTPTTIYLAGRYTLINGSGINPNEQTHVRYQLPGAITVLSDQAVDLLFSNALRSTLDAFVSLPNTRVVFIDQAPEFAFTPANCLRNPWVRDMKTHCVVAQSQVKAQFARYQRLVHDVLTDYPTVLRYSPTDALCTGQVCSAFGPDQRLWYYDHHHLNTVGGTVVAQDLLRYLPNQSK